MALGEIYLKLAVAFPDDPKVRALARYGADAGLARDLYVQMALYCKRMLSDGFVPAEQVGLLVYPLSADHGNQLAKQLASVGLIKEVSNLEAQGWQVCAYLKRNGTKNDVEALSKVRAEAGRTGGTKSRKRPAQHTSKATSKQVGNQDASKDPPIYRDRDIDRDASNEASLPMTTSSGAGKPRRTPTGTISDVVAAYIDGATEAGQPPPASSLKARVGKDARALLGQGYDLQTLVASAKTMGAGEWNDLAVQVRKDAAANGHRPAGQPRQRPASNPRDAWMDDRR